MVSSSSPASRATSSTPSRRPADHTTFSSPRSINLSPYLREDRNSEANHVQQLAAAEESHTRVREAAIAAYARYEQDLERRRVKEQQRLEEERLRAEADLAEEYRRLSILKAKSVPKPPPSPRPEEQKPPSPKQTRPTPAPLAQTNGQNGQNGQLASATKSPLPGGFVVAATKPTPALNGIAAIAQQATPPPPPPSQPLKPSSPFGLTPSQPAAAAPAQAKADNARAAAAKPAPTNPFAQNPQPLPLPLPTPTPPVPAAQTNGGGTATPSSSAADRHVEIFKKLKELRKFMLAQAQTNPALKGRVGDMRRELRKSIGQLIDGDAAANRRPRDKIMATLNEALNNAVRSTLIGPDDFVLEPREPVDGAVHNGPQLPSLFLYLINIFSKAVIAQFISEGGANPRRAEPIGVVVAKVFSAPEFCWRGRSLVDILVAKYRVVCPVLFGFRGSEKMEQGRLRLGWRRDGGGGWISEQQHGDRMTGLGAGFAAIYLRNFSRAKHANPCPPRDYWAAMARIVNTPPDQISDTQCLVLKAMIQHHEAQFLGFFGSAALAALRVALVDFPARAPAKTPAVSALQVHATLLAKDAGLRLGAF